MGIATKGFSVWWGLDSLNESGGVCFQDVSKKDRWTGRWRVKPDSYVTASNMPASNPCFRARYSEIQRVVLTRSLQSGR